MNRFSVAILVAVLVLAVGCGANADVPEPPRPLALDEVRPEAVRVQTSEFACDVPEAKLREGMTDFVVYNAGRLAHEFVVVPVHEGRYGLRSVRLKR